LLLDRDIEFGVDRTLAMLDVELFNPKPTMYPGIRYPVPWRVLKRPAPARQGKAVDTTSTQGMRPGTC
jgi:hypothetical protein